MNIVSRVRELRHVRAGDLVPHEHNWRRHPDRQRSALVAAIEEIGFAGVVVTRKLDDGRLEIIDGHLRSDLDPDATIPVVVTDLDADEANKLLLTFDPVSTMATKHDETIEELLSLIECNEGAFSILVDDLSEMLGVSAPEFSPVDGESQSSLDEKDKTKCPACGHEF